MSSKTIALWFALLAAPASVLADSSAWPVDRVGYAYAERTGELLYTESHSVLYDGSVLSDSRVTYRDANGEVFAEKRVSFADDPLMPDFELQNRATGHLESASRDGDDRREDRGRDQDR